MTSPLRFPYMVFARTLASAARFPLTQSGMPAPQAPWLELGGPPDLGFAGAEALPALQARLAERYDLPSERVLVTQGTSAALMTVALTWFEGARVVTESPSYDPLRALPAWMGSESRVVRRRAESDWRIDPDEVGRALEGSRRGHVFLTNPHNPSGAVTPPEELRALAASAERAGGLLIVDEVYMEYAPPEDRILAALLAPNAVSLSSLTKAYGLGALRLGWIALGAGVAGERAALEDAIFLNYVDPPTPILRFALRALEHEAELRANIERIERESRPLFTRWLEETEVLEGRPARYGLISFPRVPGVEDTAGLAEHLAAEYEVGVVPGEFFDQPGHLRVSFGLPPEALTEALSRLERGIRAWRER